jgi:hypothetical protein
MAQTIVLALGWDFINKLVDKCTAENGADPLALVQ